MRAVSVSLDGARAATHDGVRGIPGHFETTIAAIGQLAGAGLSRARAYAATGDPLGEDPACPYQPGPQ